MAFAMYQVRTLLVYIGKNVLTKASSCGILLVALT